MLILAVPLLGCACMQTSPIALRPPARPIETFWLAQAIGDVQRPPPPSTSLQSISLGYVGDAPLSGGMMAGDSVEEGEQQPEDDDDSAMLPALLFRHGSVHIGSGTSTRRRRRR